MRTILRWYSLMLLVIGVGAGCAAERPYTWVQELPPQILGHETEPIRIGDRVYVLVKGQEQLSGEFEVRADGAYAHPVLGRIQVAGLLPEDASRVVTERLRGIVVNPQATVAIVTLRPPIVGVLGEVRQPGRFEMTREDGVMNALARAGGLTEFANPDAVFVIRNAPRRLRVRFRFRDLSGADPKAISFKLHDGDVVVVE